MTISHQLARPFIEAWHYSNCVPTGKNIFFAWFDDNLELYAVADYGIGVNPYQAPFLATATGLPVTTGALVELKRLCRSEPKQDGFPLTSFLAECHRQLVKLGYEYVVSFSDPEWGHDGGVYKAANFVHLGQTNPEYHLVDVEGVVRHRRYAFRYARRHDVPLAQAREELGVQRIKTRPKDRWFLPIVRISKTARRHLLTAQTGEKA